MIEHLILLPVEEIVYREQRRCYCWTLRFIIRSTLVIGILKGHRDSTWIPTR